jgi:hypothetical protein
VIQDSGQPPTLTIISWKEPPTLTSAESWVCDAEAASDAVPEKEVDLFRKPSGQEQAVPV